MGGFEMVLVENDVDDLPSIAGVKACLSVPQVDAFRCDSSCSKDGISEGYIPLPRSFPSFLQSKTFSPLFGFF
jgi:hypothetical protein